MPEKRHFYWLDWIRFFAAFMVVTCHARSGNWVEWGRLGAGHHSRLILAFFTGTRAGVEWVMVFFVLSGFLVGGMALERSLNRTFDFWAFAWDRVSRIWVPLVPALVLTVGIQLYCGVRVSVPLLLGNLFALQGVICNPIGENFPLWSLSYEVWFYVLTGIAALIVTGLARRSIVWVALAVCFVVFTKLSVSYLNCWLLGAFCYFLHARPKGFSLITLGLILALLGGSLSQIEAESKSVALQSVVVWLPSRDVAFLIESLGVGFFLAAVSRKKPPAGCWAKIEAAGTSLASFSYTMYLTHYPLLILWASFLPARYPNFDLSSFLILCVKIASCLLVAWLMHLPFEAQTFRVRRWLRKFTPVPGSSKEVLS